MSSDVPFLMIWHQKFADLWREMEADFKKQKIKLYCEHCQGVCCCIEKKKVKPDAS